MWMRNNITALESGSIDITTYLQDNSPVYSAPVRTTSIDGLGLSEILDINSLMGV